MKFVSHLDMNRFMTRLANKAKLPIWFTEGFNQHAYFNFAIPLTLGFEGEYEVLDVRVTDDGYSNDRLLNDFNAVSVPDIEFYNASEPILKMKDITFAEYKIVFDSITDEIKEKIQSFFLQKSIIVEKTAKKGNIKQMDIAQLVKKAVLSENELTLILTAGNENNLNPTLVLGALFADEAEIPPYSVIRTMIYDKDLKPFV